VTTADRRPRSFAEVIECTRSKIADLDRIIGINSFNVDRCVELDPTFFDVRRRRPSSVLPPPSSLLSPPSSPPTTPSARLRARPRRNHEADALC
jgi:hypothetical protein